MTLPSLSPFFLISRNLIVSCFDAILIESRIGYSISPQRSAFSPRHRELIVPLANLITNFFSTFVLGVRETLEKVNLACSSVSCSPRMSPFLRRLFRTAKTATLESKCLAWNAVSRRREQPANFQWKYSRTL